MCEPFRNGHEKECKKLETGVATPTIWMAYSTKTSAFCPTK